MSSRSNLKERYKTSSRHHVILVCNDFQELSFNNLGIEDNNFDYNEVTTLRDLRRIEKTGDDLGWNLERSKIEFFGNLLGKAFLFL